MRAAPRGHAAPVPERTPAIALMQHLGPQADRRLGEKNVAQPVEGELHRRRVVRGGLLAQLARPPTHRGRSIAAAVERVELAQPAWRTRQIVTVLYSCIMTCEYAGSHGEGPLPALSPLVNCTNGR